MKDPLIGLKVIKTSMLSVFSALIHALFRRSNIIHNKYQLIYIINIHLIFDR